MNFRKINVLFLILTSALLSRADAGRMNAARQSQTTTLLADSNILITGGINSAGVRTTAVEMYNTTTNQYENWAGLQVARSSHTATLMSDGRVLIAGGFAAGDVPLNSTEICDPRTKLCATSLTLATPRAGHTATLLDKGTNAGQVLICGGQNAASDHSITGTCDLFNPVGPARTAAASMFYPRMGHTATSLFSGKIFVSGGRVWDTAASGGPAWLYQPNTEIYDPLTGTWAKAAALLQGRINHTATALNNGLVMIAGGYNAVNTLTCKPGSTILVDECWHYKGSAKIDNDPSIIAQNAGNHGILDGAEFFDQKGGRVVLDELSYGVAPYRNSKHSAILGTDGSWKMMGGYGGIVPTFFTDRPYLSTNTVITTVRTSSTTADIVGAASRIIVPLTFGLSRPVSGRLVDADIFFSPPADRSDASFITDNMVFFLGKATSSLDGIPVGTLIDGTTPYTDYFSGIPKHSPGEFDYMAQLTNPTGRAVFYPQAFTSDYSTLGTLVVTSAFALPDGPVYPTETEKPITGDMTAQLSFSLPDIYTGVHAIAKVVSGSIADLGKTYYIALNPAGSATLNLPLPDTCDPDLGTCSYSVDAAFTGLSGFVSNSTSLELGTTLYAPLETAGAPITLTINIYYTADTISLANRQEVAYEFDTSTMIVRGMVFNSNLRFSPKDGNWLSMTDVTSFPTLDEPLFDHTTLLTPAGTMVVMGGQNCEISTATDCSRLAPNFRPTTSVDAYDFRYSEPWPAGPMLNSKRSFHTSTLMQTGQILTCGGTDGARQLASCELMDPKTKVWTLTGSMNHPRAMHTATLLANGTVLVAGGTTSDGTSLKDAEIFYPATQRWVATGPMAQARQRHTATLLQDGNVLVAGGDNAATAEVYISSTASWLNVGSMTWPRAQHTATLLKSGNVLMVGGVGAGALYQTEIYSFSGRNFSAGPDLHVPRYAHTANLLRDGRVLVVGGSQNIVSENSAEIYDGSVWHDLMTAAGDLIMYYPRSNHRSVLLPNGKVVVTGGEAPGTAQIWSESFNPDYSFWIVHGQMSPRSGHTTVLTQDNYLINIGGWDGAKNLDTTDIAHFSEPDTSGLEAETPRQMIISTATSYFDYGMWATLLSTAANFHGVTEASGGGAGPQNSSFSNPRVYMNQIDNPSGFMIDLSTRIYSIYGGQNTNWETTLSSITIITPSAPGEMPYGWYTMRVAGNGVFSEGVPVQVTLPRPLGAPSVPEGVVMGISSITWTWTRGTIPLGGADGYNIYASSNDVFVATAAFTNSATYIETGFIPNTQASLMVNSFNQGGTGPLSRSATYYTLASSPTALTITGSSFETATLEWGSNGNSAGTLYELSMYACNVGDSLANCGLTAFSDQVSISTPIPFIDNFSSTYTSINQLTPNQGYYFRVRAVNGAGITTSFSNMVSTLTVGNVSNLTGTAISSSAISWSWDESVGADAYNVYDISEGTDSPVFVGSTTVNFLTQNGLLPNRLYSVAVNAMKTTPLINGPVSYSQSIYTLAVPPGLNTLNAFTSVSTGSLTVNWMTNGNSTWTIYEVQLSTVPGYDAKYTVSITTNGNYGYFTDLLPNLKVYARVFALNGDNRPTVPTDLGTKYTRAKAPANVRPSEISMSGVTLVWDTSDNSAQTTYEIRYTTETFAVSSTTYIPFSAGFTGSSFSFPGLLTSTTYYFDVAASNGENFVTARIQAVPAAYTLSGPSGAPAGSVGGTSDPKKEVTISGVLPTGRGVALTVPAGSFPSATPIAISSSAQNPCSYLVGGVPIEVAVFSEASAQPQVPVTLTLNYNYTESMAAIDANRLRMVLARYNPVSGQCLPLETVIDTGRRTITATINHFSTFQLMLKTAATNLSNVLIYPNPFYTNRGQGYVTITNMPAAASVRIYTLSGDKVWEGSAGTTGMLIWKAQNQSGELVASGVYLAVIDSVGGKKVFKLAVER